MGEKSIGFRKKIFFSSVIYAKPQCAIVRASCIDASWCLWKEERKFTEFNAQWYRVAILRKAKNMQTFAYKTEIIFFNPKTSRFPYPSGERKDSCLRVFKYTACQKKKRVERGGKLRTGQTKGHSKEALLPSFSVGKGRMLGEKEEKKELRLTTPRLQGAADIQREKKRF